MSNVNFSVNRVPLSFQLRRFHWRAWRDKEAQSADITVSFERSRNQKFKFEPVTGAAGSLLLWCECIRNGNKSGQHREEKTLSLLISVQKYLNKRRVLGGNPKTQSPSRLLPSYCRMKKEKSLMITYFREHLLKFGNKEQSSTFFVTAAVAVPIRFSTKGLFQK